MLTDETDDIVLSSLQLIHDCNRCAIQQRVTVVDPWQDDAAAIEGNLSKGLVPDLQGSLGPHPGQGSYLNSAKLLFHP